MLKTDVVTVLSKKIGPQATKPHGPGVRVLRDHSEGAPAGLSPLCSGVVGKEPSVFRSEGAQPSLEGQKAAPGTPGQRNGQRCGLRRLKKQKGPRRVPRNLSGPPEEMEPLRGKP